MRKKNNFFDSVRDVSDATTSISRAVKAWLYSAVSALL